MAAGQKYGCGLVEYEWDRLFTNGATPKGLQVLASSSVMNDNNVPDLSNTSYYIALSGAMVFATASIYWTSALDTYRLHIIMRRSTGSNSRYTGPDEECHECPGSSSHSVAIMA